MRGQSNAYGVCDHDYRDATMDSTLVCESDKVRQSGQQQQA